MCTTKFLHFLVMALFVPMAMVAQTSKTEAKSTFDWEPVMNAIIQIESRGRTDVTNGRYAGCMQIAPVLVNAVNNMLKKRGSSKRYTLKDRFSMEKSKEMFVIVMSELCPENDIEKACRIWAGGPGYSIKGTQPFVNKVKRVMAQQAAKKD